MRSPSNFGNMSDAPALMARKIVPKINQARFWADIYRNSRVDFLNASRDNLDFGISRSCWCGPAMGTKFCVFCNNDRVNRQFLVFAICGLCYGWLCGSKCKKSRCGIE